MRYLCSIILEISKSDPPSVSTLAALLLDIHTHRLTTRRGAYNLPEDDKDAQRLNEMKSMRVRNQGYNAPKVALFEDSDNGYHNRYGHQ